MRNQLLDPESSPSRGPGRYAPPSPSGSEKSTEDDEWYSGNAGAGLPGPGLQYRGGAGSVGNGNGNGNGGSAYVGGNFGGYGGPQAPQSHGWGAGDPGLMTGGFGPVGEYSEEDNDDVPLLEELGINFDHIFSKTLTVLYPKRGISDEIAEDTDLAGPLCFALLLGSCLLLKGKIHFGYIYGFSVFGSLSFNMVLSLLHHKQLTFWLTASVLGYSLLPVVFLSVISVLLSMKGFLGMLLSVFAVAWSTFSAIRMLDAKLKLLDQYWLVVYPLVLLYSCFTLITIF